MASNLSAKWLQVAIVSQALVLLLVSVLLSIFTNRYWSFAPVAPCMFTAGCTSNEDMGNFTDKVTYHYQGFPVPYRETTMFEPFNKSHFAIAGPQDVGMPTHIEIVTVVLIDTAFWYALLVLVMDKLLPMLRRQQTAKN